MNTPRVGIAGEGVHRGQDARTHQEGAEQRQREGQNRQQDGPDLQRVALFHHERGVQQRGAGKPWHQRGVLDGVPEPPAAPAELVIGPVGAHRDPERQEDPGDERPRPYPARPGCVDAALEQRGDGKGERDREADIAEIEHRRMHGEADVLQHGVEVPALDRRIGQPQERIRGQQDEEIESAGDPGLHREHARAQRQRQIVAERRDHAAEQGKDRDPQDHGALVIAPDAGDLVDQRFQRVRVLVDIGDRKVRRHMQGDERGKRRQHESELRQRRRTRDVHQRGVAPVRAENGHDRLDQRKGEREHQRIMSAFGDHEALPASQRVGGVMFIGRAP